MRWGKERISRVLLSLLTVGIVVVTTGCTKMVEGVVVGKEYDDPDTWTSTYCASYRQNGTCAFHGIQTHYDGPHWYFELDGTNDKGERDRGQIEVGADEYNVFGIGAVYPGRPGQPVEYVDGGDAR